MAIPNEQAYQKSIRDDTSLRIDASIKELPDVTAEDNGNVLTVVEGAWAKAAPSGGSDLPTVTTDDNSQVLTVVNGAWNKANVPDGSETFVVAETQQVTTTQKEWGVVAEPTGADYSLSDFKDGDYAELYIDGEKTDVPLTLHLSDTPPFVGGYLYGGGDISAQIYIDATTVGLIDNDYFQLEAGTTHTFAVNVVSPSTSVAFVDVYFSGVDTFTTSITNQELMDALTHRKYLVARVWGNGGLFKSYYPMTSLMVSGPDIYAEFTGVKYYSSSFYAVNFLITVGSVTYHEQGIASP